MKYGDHKKGQFSQAKFFPSSPPPPPSLKEEQLDGQKSQIFWVWQSDMPNSFSQK